MKRIAIFCDGTWNRSDAPHPTNVVRMAQAVKLTAADGRSQQVFYVMGVGTGRGSNAVARWADRMLGGALGWGLTENIEDAYRALVFCYEPGDELFIFGFSRGAYTARSLAGLIRSCGIPPRENVHRVGEALARYRARTPQTKPNDPESFLFRAEFAPYTATSQEEWNWRQATRPGMCHLLTIHYLGVWDTVGALGVPGFWMAAPLVNRQYQFHDADLSRSVLSARHAVAIDERRKTFPPTLWDNLDDLNRRALDLGDAPWPEGAEERWPYRQEWFPGDHGSVGGGGDRQGLSAYTFDFIAQGAKAAGLDLRDEVIASATRPANIREALVNKPGGGLMARLMRLQSAYRAGPDRVQDVARATADRIACDATYRPKALARVIDAIQRRLGGPSQ